MLRTTTTIILAASLVLIATMQTAAARTPAPEGAAYIISPADGETVTCRTIHP